MNRSYNSKKLLKKKKKALKWKIILLAILFVLLIIGFVYLMNHPLTNINSVEMNETELVSAEDLKSRVDEIINKDLLFVLPKTNFLFIPRYEIKKTLKEYVPIKDVNFEVKDKTLKIQVEEYEPVALWCIDEENSCKLVNEDGVAFYDWSLKYSLKDLIRFVHDGENPTDGDSVIDKSFMFDVVDFVEKLKGLDIKVFAINYSGEDVYRVQTNKGFEIVISSQDDLDSAFENIETIFEKETLSGEIDYIDLRFGNKIFYKLRD